MRRMCAALIALMLALTPVCAMAGVEDTLFDDAKEALTLMSYGEFDKAAKKLGFSDGGDDLRTFTDENLTDIYTITVQTDVAVAYRYGDGWRLAVPIEDPSNGGVLVFVVASVDGETVDNYGFLRWKNIQKQVDESDEVVWNGERSATDVPVIVADD